MGNNHSTNQKRRNIIKGTAAVAASVAMVPGIRFLEVAQAKNSDEEVTSAVRWGMLIDTTQCGDCDSCVKACEEENGLEKHDRPLIDPKWIRKLEVEDKSTGYGFSLPMMCQHCETPPCVDVCPTGASFKRKDGIVLVDKHTCIGCRYCMMACPYKARSFEHEEVEGQRSYAPRGKGTVEACTLCVHRVDEGQQPACVDACQKTGQGGMVFGDLNDPTSEISQRLSKEGGKQIRADLSLNTGVRYQGL
jgi:molybdopterin-containing oxidoreductase family iron-sulfur binding subunit